MCAFRVNAYVYPMLVLIFSRNSFVNNFKPCESCAINRPDKYEASTLMIKSRFLDFFNKDFRFSEIFDNYVLLLISTNKIYLTDCVICVALWKHLA